MSQNTINLRLENNPNSGTNSSITLALPADGKKHTLSSLKVVSGSSQAPYHATSISTTGYNGVPQTTNVQIDDPDTSKKIDFVLTSKQTPHNLQQSDDVSNWTARTHAQN